METETIKLEPRERIDVIKDSIEYSINGPASVIVMKEEAAAETTAMDNQKIIATISDGYVFQDGRAIGEYKLFQRN